MAMIECKCPNCNGVMQVDADAEKAICPYCGTTTIIARPINIGRDYIKNQTNNIQQNNESPFKIKIDFFEVGIVIIFLVILFLVHFTL